MRRSVILSIMALLFISFTSLVIARDRSNHDPKRIIADIDSYYAKQLKSILGQDFRKSRIAPINMDHPDTWASTVEYVDSAASGDVSQLFRIVAVAKFLMEDLPLIDLKTVEVRILRNDSEPRCVASISYPINRTILANFLRLKDADRLPAEEKDALLGWMISWKFDKKDVTWTTADYLISANTEIAKKTEEQSTARRDDVPKWVITRPCAAAPTKEIAQDITRMIVQNDIEAIAALILAGKAIPLKETAEIFMMDYGWLYSRIRLKGSPVPLWVSSDFVDTVKKPKR